MLPTTFQLISNYPNTPISELVFYIPGQFYTQDTLVIRNGFYVGRYSNLTLEQQRIKFPNMTIMSLDEVATLSEEAAKKSVSEISSEKYNDMLEMLPPLGLVLAEKAASFKFMEMYSGNVANIFARVVLDERMNPDDSDSPFIRRYFTLRDKVTLSHSEIIKRCYEYINLNKQ